MKRLQLQKDLIGEPKDVIKSELEWSLWLRNHNFPSSLINDEKWFKPNYDFDDEGNKAYFQSNRSKVEYSNYPYENKYELKREITDRGIAVYNVYKNEDFLYKLLDSFTLTAIGDNLDDMSIRLFEERMELIKNGEVKILKTVKI